MAKYDIMLAMSLFPWPFYWAISRRETWSFQQRAAFPLASRPYLRRDVIIIILGNH
jgi:hypothetical protein